MDSCYDRLAIYIDSQEFKDLLHEGLCVGIPSDRERIGRLLAYKLGYKGGIEVTSSYHETSDPLPSILAASVTRYDIRWKLGWKRCRVEIVKMEHEQRVEIVTRIRRVLPQEWHNGCNDKVKRRLVFI